MSERGQMVMVWWGLIFMYIFGFTLWGLLHMWPTPPAYWTAAEVVSFYKEHSSDMRLGAMISSWTSAFAMPIQIVVACQMLRAERNYSGPPIWAITTLISGALMSMFLVFPAIIWGTAAFTPDRDPNTLLALHELGTLTFMTTDQFYIFGMVAIGLFSLFHKDPGDGTWPFPRWFGYFTLWAAIAFEPGAIAFVTKHGLFAWNGLFIFWVPVVVYSVWMSVLCYKMLRALKAQKALAQPWRDPLHTPVVRTSSAAS